MLSTLKDNLRVMRVGRSYIEDHRFVDREGCQDCKRLRELSIFFSAAGGIIGGHMARGSASCGSSLSDADKAVQGSS